MMNVEGFEVDIFVETFDHLVSGENAGRAFMAKNDRLRNLWLEKFFNKTYELTLCQKLKFFILN